MSYTNSYPHKIADYPENTEYIVLLEEQYSYNDGYDNDRTGNYLQILTFETLDQIKKWILQPNFNSYSKNYKILKVKSCSVVKTIEIKIE